MVEDSLVMLNEELTSEGRYSLVDKIISLATGQTIREPESSYDMFKDKPSRGIHRAIPNRFHFIPPCKVVGCNDYITCLGMPRRWVYGPNEINNPLFENLVEI
jgi:hypothetical protein